MRFLFICILVFFAALAQAQELTKISDFKNLQQEKEEYYVLKKDGKTKHGNYKLIDTYSKYVLEEGFYKNNLKDSLWIEYLGGTPHKMKEGYFIKGKKNNIWRICAFQDNAIFLRAKGAYLDDLRVGPWHYFNKEGETIEVYDYTRDTLLYAKDPLDSARVDVFEVLINNTWQKRKLGKGPELISDEDEKNLMLDIAKKMQYPMKAAREGIEGTVQIGFTVNEQGTVSDLYIHKKVHSLLDAEALRVAKLVPLKFNPGLLLGKPVTSRMILPLKFTIR